MGDLVPAGRALDPRYLAPCSPRDRPTDAGRGLRLCLDADGRILLCRIAPSILPARCGPARRRARLRRSARGGHPRTRRGAGYDGEIVALPTSRTGCSPTRTGRLHAIRIVYRVRIIGGELRDEVDGSTDLWLVHREEAAAPPRRARAAGRRRLRGTAERCTARSRSRSRRGRPWSSRWPGTSSAGSDSSPTTAARARSSGAPTAGWSRTSSRDGRSSASWGWACRSPGDRGRGRARDAAAPVRPRRRRDEGDGRHLADRTDRRPGARVTIDHDFRPRVAALRGLRRPVSSRGRSPAGRWRRSRRSPRRWSPNPPSRRISRHERPAARLDHRDRDHHPDRDRPATRSGPGCGRGDPRSGGSTGSTRVRSGATSRRRSTTSTRSPGCRRRPPDSSTGSASSGSWRGGWRSTTPG